MVLLGPVDGAHVEENGIPRLAADGQGALPGPFLGVQPQVREGVDMPQGAELVRARHHVQRAVGQVRVHHVIQGAARTFVLVLEIGRVLVQVLGMAAHGLFVEALTVAEQLDVRTEDGLDDVQRLRIDGGPQEDGAGGVVDAQHHDLLIPLEALRRRQEERPVGGAPAFDNPLGLVQQGDGLLGRGLDVPRDLRDVLLHQAADDEATVLLVDRGCALEIDIRDGDLQVLNRDGREFCLGAHALSCSGA